MTIPFLKLVLGLGEFAVGFLDFQQLGFEVIHHLMAELPQGGALAALFDPIPLASKVGLHLAHELEGIDGFGNEPVAARHQGRFPIAFHGLCRQGDDGNVIEVGVLTELRGHFKPR